MSDIKIIKVSNGGGAKVDSSGFFIKPKQPEPSQLSQFIQKENERERKKEYDDDDDKDSVDSMTVSDVSSATQQSHEDDEYTNESITPTPTPLPVPSQYQTPIQTPKVSSIVRDETLNSYLEKPKVELPRMDASESIPVSAPISSNAQLNNSTVHEEENNNNAKSTTAQPANNRNDYYSDAEEDVIDMTDNKLYDILSSVLEDEDGENVSENMAKMNRNLEKVITMFEAYQQNNTKDEYLSKIGEAIENQNKILSQIIRVLEKQGQSNLETNIKEDNKENEKKHKKHEKSVSSESSESSVESVTDDTEKNPNIKKVRISNSIKHSTSKDLPLKHRIQIKKKP